MAGTMVRRCPPRNPKTDPRAGDVFLRPHMFGGDAVRVEVRSVDETSIEYATWVGAGSMPRLEFLDYIAQSTVSS